MAVRTEERSLWLALGVLLPGPFLIFADSAVLVLAIPTIQRELGGTTGHMQLVLAGYQVAFGVAVLIGGRLGDMYGRRRVFAVGLLCFAATSLAGGLATSAGTLILARVAQGLAAALVMPQDAAFIRTRFPTTLQPKAYGVLGSVTATAGVAGPVIGGLLIGLDAGGLSWRLPLLINVPLCLLNLWLLRWVPESRPSGPGRLDVFGGLLAAAGMFLLLVPVAFAGSAPLGPLWMLLLPGVLLLFVFVLVERRRVAGGELPLLDPGVFTDRTFRLGALLFLLLFAAVGGYTLTYAYFLQAGLGFTPLVAALLIVPSPLGSTIGALWSDRVSRWWHGQGLALGLILLTATVAGMAAAVALTPTRWLPATLAPLVFASGLSLGLATPGLLGVVLARVGAADAGAASGAVSTVQQVARSFGVAAIGSLFFVAAPGVADGTRQDLTTAYGTVLVVLTGLFAASAGVLVRLLRQAP